MMWILVDRNMVLLIEWVMNNLVKCLVWNSLSVFLFRYFWVILFIVLKGLLNRNIGGLSVRVWVSDVCIFILFDSDLG